MSRQAASLGFVDGSVNLVGCEERQNSQVAIIKSLERPRICSTEVTHGPTDCYDWNCSLLPVSVSTTNLKINRALNRHLPTLCICDNKSPQRHLHTPPVNGGLAHEHLLHMNLLTATCDNVPRGVQRGVGKCPPWALLMAV